MESTPDVAGVRVCVKCKLEDLSVTDVPQSAPHLERPPKLRPQEAIAIAKDGLKDLFKDESITNLGLEEVEYDPQRQHWLVTLGFSRPWNKIPTALTVISGQTYIDRSLKTTRISDSEALIISVKNITQQASKA